MYIAMVFLFYSSLTEWQCREALGSVEARWQWVPRGGLFLGAGEWAADLPTVKFVHTREDTQRRKTQEKKKNNKQQTIKYKQQIKILV